MIEDRDALFKELYQVESEINSLREKRGALVSKKNTVEKEGVNAKERIHRSGKRLSDAEYQGLMRECNRCVRVMNDYNRELAAINVEVARWRTLETNLRLRLGINQVRHYEGQNDVLNDVMQKLLSDITKLRNEHLSFAEDQTRVNSMRIMAAQFANELTTIIARYR